MEIIDQKTTEVKNITYQTKYPFITYHQTLHDGVVNSSSYQIKTPESFEEDAYFMLLHIPDFEKNKSSITVEELYGYGIDTSINIDEVPEEELFLFYSSGHILFDMNFNVEPFVSTFNYIGTPFSSEVLDLEKAIEVLKVHPWVVNKDELEIKLIPYYNNEGGNDTFINVSLLPDKETFNEMYQTVKDQKYWSVRLKELIHDGYIPTETRNRLGLLVCLI